jgi:hypothetical protein
MGFLANLQEQLKFIIQLTVVKPVLKEHLFKGAIGLKRQQILVTKGHFNCVFKCM